jgi:integrase/recombinase XerD
MSVYKRGKTWWVRIIWNGKEIRKSAKTTSKREAEDFERRIMEELGRIYRGGKERVTYRQAMLRYLDEYLPTLKIHTARNYRTYFKHLHFMLDGLYLDQFKRQLFNEIVSHLRVKTVGSKENPRLMSENTIIRYLQALSSFLAWCVQMDYLEQNPILTFKPRLRHSKPRTRYLSKPEYERLLNRAPDYLKGMIVVAVETGMRKEELLSLEWSQVDRRRKEILLTKTKTDAPRVVALSAEAMAQILAQERYGSEGYVFKNKQGTRWACFKKSFRTACQEAGVSNLRWHDLRRTCGCWLLQSGVDIYTVGKFLGHKSVAVTERSYAFMLTQQLHDAINIKTQATAQNAAQALQVINGGKAGKLSE